MKNLISRISAIVIIALAFVVLAQPSAMAAPGDILGGTACNTSSGAEICGGTGDGIFGVIKTIIEVLLIAAGIIAVIMIIVGGIRYVTSGGDQNSVKAAKDTVLYSVIGLVITILAFAIVRFVIGKL